MQTSSNITRDPSEPVEGALVLLDAQRDSIRPLTRKF